MTIRQNLKVNQGETFSFVYVHQPDGSVEDLTGQTSRMSIRDRVGGSIYAYLSTESDSNGGTIALGGVSGTVTITMSATETDSLASGSSLHDIIKGFDYGNPESLVYDLELIDGDTVTRALEGSVELRRSVTL